MQQWLFNPVVLAEIVLPNGTSYKFTYDVYGEIDKVTYPTGAYDKYTYAQFPAISGGMFENAFFQQANRGVVTAIQSEGGTQATETTSHYSPLSGGQATTAPDGSHIVR